MCKCLRRQEQQSCSLSQRLSWVTTHSRFRSTDRTKLTSPIGCFSLLPLSVSYDNNIATYASDLYSSFCTDSSSCSKSWKLAKGFRRKEIIIYSHRCAVVARKDYASRRKIKELSNQKICLSSHPLTKTEEESKVKLPSLPSIHPLKCRDLSSLTTATSTPSTSTSLYFQTNDRLVSCERNAASIHRRGGLPNVFSVVPSHFQSCPHSSSQDPRDGEHHSENTARVSPRENGSRVYDDLGFSLPTDPATTAALGKYAQYFAPKAGRREKRWQKYLLHDPQMSNFRRLKALVRKGIPDNLRSRIWSRCIGSDTLCMTRQGEYDRLKNVKIGEEIVNQIDLDVRRTFPNHKIYHDRRNQTDEPQGPKKLRNVLHAFAAFNPDVNYCQSMNFVAAVLLLFMGEELAFWSLVQLLCPLKGVGHKRRREMNIGKYYVVGMTGIRRDLHVMKLLLEKRFPDVYSTLQNRMIDIDWICAEWFLCLFSTALPMRTVLRVWDLLMLEGHKILFRVGLALFKWHGDELQRQQTFEGLLRYLKQMPREMFQHNEFTKMVLYGLGSFSLGEILHLQETADKEVAVEDKLKAQREVRNAKELKIEDHSKADPYPLSLDFITQFLSLGDLHQAMCVASDGGGMELPLRPEGDSPSASSSSEDSHSSCHSMTPISLSDVQSSAMSSPTTLLRKTSNVGSKKDGSVKHPSVDSGSRPSARSFCSVSVSSSTSTVSYFSTVSICSQRSEKDGVDSLPTAKIRAESLSYQERRFSAKCSTVSLSPKESNCGLKCVDCASLFQSFCFFSENLSPS